MNAFLLHRAKRSAVQVCRPGSTHNCCTFAQLKNEELQDAGADCKHISEVASVTKMFGHVLNLVVNLVHITVYVKVPFMVHLKNSLFVPSGWAFEHYGSDIFARSNMKTLLC